MSQIDLKREVAALAAELRARAEATEDLELYMPIGVKRKAENISEPVTDESALAVEPEQAADDKRESRLAALAKVVDACRQCPLGATRLRSVFGVGSATAQVLFVGEGPGFKEDHEGEPFIGRAGQLLDKILESIGLSREAVYIANIVKCHPMVNPSDPESHGNDRPPTPEEIAACRHFLDDQISVISPRVIVTLGSVATKVLLGEDVPITKVRGHWREYRTPGDSRAIKLLPTFHPAALLRNPVLKRDVWTDMKNLKKELDS